MKSIFEFGNKNPEFVNKLLEYKRNSVYTVSVYGWMQS